jgi:hypothetical protein
LAKVKLLFLIQLKTEYDEQFIQEAPLSLEFFDRWWTAETFHEVIDQQDILDNLDPKWSKQLVPTGRPLVDDMIQRIATREPRTKFDVEVPRYRVWWEGDVVGWVDDFVWDFPHLSGKWSPTVNPKGREFASLGEVGIVYPVVLDGASYLHGELVQRPDGVTIKVQLVSAQRQREATEPAPAPERAGGK